MAPPTVHPFYRLWFTWADPISLLPTVYGILYNREFIMDGLIPASQSVANPDHGFLFHQLAALYGFVGFMLAATLRATSELKVWRVVVAGVLGIDLALLASLYVSLEQQGRLGVEHMRWQDWGQLVYTGGVAVIRSLFLLGVGSVTAGEKKRV
ncbi:hypothetical protein F5X68DRAFT_212564 [Plectosphaerella plurivora]|uniref:DUF7704 domain-containing protein n=1 Tax=Plectosphaerella plurivora TaxID=936078 RepID=A0A9P8V6W3_9PEZI|nr:hypothetical protein F5X68DRAFT_212564 [Plectosphaerella plurivora]